MVAEMPSLDRVYGRDKQGALFYLAFWAGWETCLSQERGFVGALPLLTPTDLEPLAAVGKPKKGNGKNRFKTKCCREGRFPSVKREIGNSKNCASKDNVSICTESSGAVAIRKYEMTFLCTQSKLIGVWCCTWQPRAEHVWLLWVSLYFLNFLSLSSPAWMGKMSVEPHSCILVCICFPLRRVCVLLWAVPCPLWNYPSSCNVQFLLKQATAAAQFFVL